MSKQLEAGRIFRFLKEKSLHFFEKEILEIWTLKVIMVRIQKEMRYTVEEGFYHIYKTLVEITTSKMTLVKPEKEMRNISLDTGEKATLTIEMAENLAESLMESRTYQ